MDGQSKHRISLFAAGSLQSVLTEVTEQFQAFSGIRTITTFGPSGLLRDRILNGENADVFASANTEHPTALVKAGIGLPVSVFVQNQMCAIAASHIGASSDNLLETMLDSNIKLGISTPEADPAGDYAWMVLGLADKILPGSASILRNKAIKLTGMHGTTASTKGSVYGELVNRGQADLFLTYYTNAVLAKKAFPELRLITMPPILKVSAEYGMTVVLRKKAKCLGFLTL